MPLFRNKIWLFASLSTIVMLLGVVGLGTFIPKMFEYGFRQKASTTGSATGVTKELGTAIGEYKYLLNMLA